MDNSDVTKALIKINNHALKKINNNIAVLVVLNMIIVALAIVMCIYILGR